MQEENIDFISFNGDVFSHFLHGHETFLVN